MLLGIVALRSLGRHFKIRQLPDPTERTGLCFSSWRAAFQITPLVNFNNRRRRNGGRPEPGRSALGCLPLRLLLPSTIEQAKRPGSFNVATSFLKRATSNTPEQLRLQNPVFAGSSASVWICSLEITA